MDNQNNPINNNPNDNNNASSSGKNPAISEEELAEESYKFFRYYSNLLISEMREKNSIDLTEIKQRIQAARNWKLTSEMIAEIEAQVESLFVDNDSDDSSEIDWEEAEEEKIERVKENNLKIEALLEQQENQLQALKIARKEKAVSTLQGQAVIKGEISQELTAIKESFENIKISEITIQTIENKLNKKIAKAKSEANQKTGTGSYILANIPVVSMGILNEQLAKEQRAFEKVIREEGGEMIKKLVSNATADLEKQRKKAVKKLGQLVEARESEVVKAKEIIQALETLNKEGKEKYQVLKKEKNEEIGELQKSIEELNNRLKKYERTKEELRIFTEQKASGKKTIPKAVMKNEEDKIKELEKEITEMVLALKIANAGWDSEKLELEQTKAKLDRETTRFKNTIFNKENELQRERKIFLDRQSELTAQIRQWEERHKKLRADWDAEEERETDLEAENKDLKNKNDRLKAEKRELEETIKGLQPSYAYQLAEKFGIIKLKNIAVNATVIVGLLAIVYAISLVLKYIARPAWLNLAGFFPKSKKRKVITVEAEQEEEEEEEEEKIFEVEEKPKLPKKVKVLRSNTKVKPKSKTQ